MKQLPLLLALSLLLPAGVTSSAGTASGSESPASAERPLRVSFTTDLVSDFPIEVTATTTENQVNFTFGPKEDGHYCTIDAVLDRNDDGSARITTSFSEETSFAHGGEGEIRRVGFMHLSVVLNPGEEETIFSSGEKTFVVGLEDPNTRAGQETAEADPGESVLMEPAVEYAMGEFPQGVSLADLNGNGHLDVMTADRHDQRISVRLGTGNGTFGEAATYSTNPDPVFVRAADLNGNGIADMISANHSNSVTVFLGNGDGTFDEGTHYATGEGEMMTTNVTVADFTGNGIPDLATANFLDDSISLLPGKGDGVFGEAVHVAVGHGPLAIVSADFNNDGHADLAVANRHGNTATVLLGNGDGTFTASDFEIGRRAGFIAAGDLTNNGTVDLVVPALADRAINILEGDGTGDFTRRDIDLGMSMPSSLTLGDVNGDGWLDIIAVSQAEQSLVVILNGADGEFSSQPRLFRVGAAPDAVAAGDLNGDGLADLVAANLRGNSVSVLLSSKDGEPGRTAPSPSATEGIASADELLTGGELTLIIEFETPEDEPAEFEEVNIYVMNMARASFQNALQHRSTEKNFRATFDELPEGRYMVYTFTGSLQQMNDASRPGAFRDQEIVLLGSSPRETTVTIRYEAFDPDSLRGSETVAGKVLDVEGQPVADLELRALVHHQSAGEVNLGTTRTDGEGGFQFENFAAEQEYQVVGQDRNRIGTIASGRDNTLTIAPQVGQTAPDIEFVHLASDETRKLSDFRGKVVLVDFWATWCGPCQEPMENLQTYAESNPDWGDQVELIALSIDDNRQTAERHLESNGWTKSYNAWAGNGGFRAEAPQAFQITGIPTAYLIDQDGKVAARGHPMSMNIPQMINRLLAGEPAQ